MVLLYFLLELSKIKIYLFSLTNRYITYISKQNLLEPEEPPKRNISNNRQNQKANDVVIYETKNNLDIKNDNMKVSNMNSEVKNSEEKKLNALGSSIDLQLISSQNKKTEFQKSTEAKNDDDFFRKYLATSPDEMYYDDAIVFEKRTFLEHFTDGLKEKQIIAHTFIAYHELKPRTMKVIVFILNVIFYFVVNGLFFSESVIRELYEVDEDKENFFSYFPRSIQRIVYSNLVSIVIGIITDFFFIEEIKLKKIFKREKSQPIILRQKIVELINDIKKRNIAFIIISSIILLFSFFYLLCFNYVYPYSQIEWIKSSITIVIIMQILSTLKCFLESGLRFLSFKCKSEKLYKISKFID
jgi:acetone carboxylase gamma subunit